MQASDAGSGAIPLSPADLDAVTRTVATEAGNPDAWGAVANSIRNRLLQGSYGDTPSAIVTAKNQYEVWGNGRAQALDSNSEQYQRAARVVAGVFSGALPDNVSGATDFFSPASQAALGRAAPAWAAGQPLATVGGNAFYATRGRVTPQAGRAPAAALGYAGDSGPAAQANPDDVFAELMGHAAGNGGTPPASAPPSATAPAPAAQPDAAAPMAANPDDVFGELMAHAAGNVPKGGGAQSAAPAQAQAPAARPPVPADDPAPTDSPGAAFVSGAIGGVPIVGNALLGGAERLSAFQRSMDRGTPFANELATVQAADAARASDHPWASAGGNALGATLAMAPAAAAAPAAFGMARGVAPVKNMLAAAGTGAGIGFADDAARNGPSAEGLVKNALTGAVFGAAGPVVGEGAGYLGNALLGKIGQIRGARAAGIPAPVVNALVPAFARDGGEDGIRNALLGLGPDGMLADVGSATKGVAQGVALLDEGKPLIQALKDRAAGTNARVDQAVKGLGPYEDPVRVSADLGDQRAALGAQYDQVHAAAPPVDVSAVVRGIDSQLQTATGAQRSALQNIRNELVATPASVDPETGTLIPEIYVDSSRILHNVRQDIDAAVKHGDPTLGVEKGAVQRNNGSLKAVRGALDDALKTQVPGMADLDAQSSSLARQMEAVQDGVDTLSSPKGSPGPAAFKQAFDAKPIEEQVAQAKGLIGEINRLAGVNKNDLNAMDNAMQGRGVDGEGGFGAQKAKAVLGDTPVDNLLTTIGRERQFGQTVNDVAGNAQTAFRTEAANSLKQKPQMGLGVDVSGKPGVGMITQALKSAIYDPTIRLLLRSDPSQRNAMLAKVLSATGPERDAFVDKLFKAAGYTQSAPAWAGTLGNTGNLLTQAGQQPYRLATDDGNALTRPLTIRGPSGR